MKRSALVFPCVAVAAVAAVAALAGPLGARRAEAASPVAFEATFETSDDFYDRFDMGYSGPNPWDFASSDGILAYHGDHDASCQGPTTQRDVAFGGDQEQLDFSQIYWHCAPGGDPAKGHVMTGVDTVSYNIAWFSPRALFTDVTEVCWDINLTEMSRRKWTQVLFVGEDDAVRYPADQVEDPNQHRPYRGSGGYDLGFTSPDFRDINGPTTGVHPESGTMAGFKSVLGNASWFQDQDTWTTPVEGVGEQITGVTDKAARYTHCLQNQPDDTIRLTQATPDGTRTIDMPGQIPTGTVRVVFQDDNYNGPKDELYDSGVVTWHWDNIKVNAAATSEVPAPPPTTAPPPPSEEAAAGPAEQAATGGTDTAGSSGPGRTTVAMGLGLLVLVVAGVVLFVLLRPGRPGGNDPSDPMPPLPDY